MWKTLVERFYEAHNPAWHADSCLGQFKTLSDAVRAVQEAECDGRGQIYRHVFIRLPFGWHLERMVRLTDWRE